MAESIPDYYYDDAGFQEQPAVSFEQIAERVGERIEGLTVRDVMSTRLLKIGADQPVRRAATIMTDNRVHRLLVTQSDTLIGIVTALDLVRLIAQGRLRP